MAISRLKMAKDGNKNFKPAEHFFIDISINLHLHTLTKFFLPLVTVIPAQTMTSFLHGQRQIIKNIVISLITV
ncbi:MAG: hypothetical protein ACI4OV_02480, partial [Victivallaceae bacterium]